MEENAKVSSFIKSRLLLDKEFNQLFMYLYEKSEEIERIMGSFTDDRPVFPGDPRITVDYYRTLASRERALLRRYLMSGERHTRRLDKRERLEIQRMIAGMKREYFKKSITAIKRRSTAIQNRLSKFENARNTNLDILTSLTLFVCKKCKNLISRDRFKHSGCACGKKIQKVSDTTKVPIASFNKTLRELIAQNYWLEYGIDHLLKRKAFDTLCGYGVLGHSGFIHEIDNIAESRTSNFRFFCECKTGAVKAGEVFILAGKMADVGCTRGYIFTVQKEVSKEVVHLARSRNISLVTEVLERTESELIREIKE